MAELIKSYDAYLFDWDGTLAMTLEIWLKVLRTELANRHISASDSDIARGFGDWSHFTNLGVEPEKLADFGRDAKSNATRALPYVALYDGVQSMMDRLHAAEKKTALITTSPRDTVDAAVAHGELIASFDALITGDRLTAHKPDPQGILIALQELNIPKERAVMLGDSDKDLGAAKNAGIDSILFYPESHELFYDLAELEKFEPVLTIRSWDEISA